MIDKVSAVGVYPSAPEGVQLKGGKDQMLGKDDFLKILITELTHQDPLEPLKDREMIAQMAQLSQLEQITQFTHSVDKMFDNINSMLNAYKTLQASSMVGRWVKMEGLPTLVVKDGEIMPVSFELPDDADVAVKIYDSQGNVVHQEELGPMEKGLHLFTPDTDLADGTYTVTFTARDSSGNDLTVKVFGWDKVVEIERSDQEVRLITESGKTGTLDGVVAFR